MGNELIKIQRELNAPKNQWNKFGNYSYRNCEDILEGLKPLLEREKCYVTLVDKIKVYGERFYIKAYARLWNAEGVLLAESYAYAREPENKKGMDEPQVTGTASSYARKYALHGLFLCDDNKDQDYHNNSLSDDVETKEKQPRVTHEVKLGMVKTAFDESDSLERLDFLYGKAIEYFDKWEAKDFSKKTTTHYNKIKKSFLRPKPVKNA